MPIFSQTEKRLLVLIAGLLPVLGVVSAYAAYGEAVYATYLTGITMTCL